MKRSTVFRRLLIVDALLLLAAAGVVVGLVKICFVPAPIVYTPQRVARDSMLITTIMSLDTVANPFDMRLDTLPGGCTRLDVDRRISQSREFNDSNYLHLQAAGEIGIEPIFNDYDAWDIHAPVVHVRSCPEYYVDKLSHSLPYLVPQAEWLLRDIGRSFRDSLESRGGGEYRVKVTSLLRTGSSVRRLRRRNGNAVNHSAHLYGTTFDISYSNFACDSAYTVARSTDDLRLLLAEILRRYHDEGFCYVKHERKQSCFHITARPVEYTLQGTYK